MDFNLVCKLASKQLNEDPAVVYKTALLLFKFIREIMSDPNDTHDILIRKLFRFSLKPRFKENKQKQYSPKAI